MNKEEAYQAMLDGHKVTNEYYDVKEYVFLNKDRKIQTEDGVVHGTRFDEFWAVRQSETAEWSIFKETPSVIIAGHADAGKAALIVEAMKSAEKLGKTVAVTSGELGTLISENTSTLLQTPDYIHIVEKFSDYGDVPNKLQMLRKLNLTPEQRDYFLNAPSERMEGEKFEDYKVRRTLNKLMLKYRGEF